VLIKKSERHRNRGSVAGPLRKADMRNADSGRDGKGWLNSQFSRHYQFEVVGAQSEPLAPAGVTRLRHCTVKEAGTE
jgi:hypothetical protein